MQQNLANQTNYELQKIMSVKNNDLVVNNSDKNLGAAMADSLYPAVKRPIAPEYNWNVASASLFCRFYFN